ncbi:hypothetical protein E4U22_006910 [Claviceps purpurea]|nr:hypothetical protein E4U22_006910 [Claviceps purpurea]
MSSTSFPQYFFHKSDAFVVTPGLVSNSISSKTFVVLYFSLETGPRLLWKAPDELGGHDSRIYSHPRSQDS